jgi:hypothetical protein
MQAQEKTVKAINLVKRVCPGFKVIEKQDSWLHKTIGWSLKVLGNKEYMESYVTTIGTTAAIPADYVNNEDLWITILHEGQHAKDCSGLGFWMFSFCYLFPQILALLGLVSFVIVLLATGWVGSLWILLSLLFVLPVPAFGRACIELRGYTVTTACLFWSGSITNEKQLIESLTKIFAGSGYYYMWPFKGFIKSYFENKLTELRTNTFVLDSYLAACKVLCKELV